MMKDEAPSNTLNGVLNRANPDQVHFQIIRMIALCWILQKIISRKLWLSDRAFPLLEPHPVLSYYPDFLHFPLWIGSLTALILLLLFPDSRRIMSMVLFTELISCLPDQNRWQPWEYQFLSMILIYRFSINRNHAANAWIIYIIAALYTLSGLSKLNLPFVYFVWKEQILEAFLHLNTNHLPSLITFGAGFLPGFIEMIAGIGLLFTTTRKYAVKVLIAMHVFIFAFIGPAGLQHNIVVWPWNLAMIGILLFIRNIRFQFEWSSFIKHGSMSLLLLFFWGVLPLCSYAGWWDRYLSARLYSGNSPKMIICTKMQVSVPSPKERPIQNGSEFPCNPDQMISLNKWALDELKVPVYPEIRIFQLLKSKLKIKYPGEDLKFYITQPGIRDSIIWIPFPE